MDRKRVFIHIGLAKTGTKSIQYALAQRRSKLARAGWLYPIEGTTTNRSGHHGFAWFMEGVDHKHPGLQRFEIAAFKAAVASARDKNLIISSEGLSALSNKEQGIDALVEYFPDHEAVVIAYAREQADLVNSRYGEILGSLTDPGPIDSFAARIQEIDLFNYPRFFRKWKRKLGDRLIVRPFDSAALKDNDLVEDFAHQLGVAPILKPYPEPKNTGNNVLQTALLAGLVRLLSQNKQRWEPYSELHRRLRRTVAGILDDKELQGAESYWGLSAERTQTLRDHYRESNAVFFSDASGRPFEFSSLRRQRRCNAIAYEDLPLALRSRSEQTLMQALEAGDRINRLGGEGSA